MPHRIIRGALGALLLFAITACTEKFTSSLACPQLCGDQSATLLDTTLTGTVVLDTAVTGFPLFGAARDFTIIAQGDSADVRLISRFDTIPNLFRHPNATVDSAVTRIDSATLVFVVDTSIPRPIVPITLDAYDVDTTAADSNRAALIPLFRPDRLIGTATYQPTEFVRDTLKLPISNAVMLAKATAGTRLRIGLRLRNTTQPARLRIAGSIFAPRITYRVSPDTLVAPDTVRFTSLTPADDPTLAAVYALYPIVVSGVQPIPGPGVLAVGGVGGARMLLRFALPPLLVDSVNVIRASLILQQIPSRVLASSSDSISVLVNPVIAGPQLTDPFLLAQFSGSGAAIGLETVRLVPKDAGQRSIELVNLFRVWRNAGTANSIRAIVIRADQEASSAAELNFVSTEGPLAQRPRLQLTYVPRRGFGLP
ncbi:MAG TPA: hypothetical protein VGP25_03210 [Gemmatimonadaceae bacterium]|nr:hypothetical protein [Gemmatimonadaceae bacterium]